MKYHLDTNVCINVLAQRNARLAQRFLAVPLSEKVICCIVRAELFYGANKSLWRATSLEAIETFLADYPTVNFDSTAAQIQGRLRAELERQGTPIGPYDLQIAALALAHQAILVTHNTREFSRIPNLQLEDWEI
jgi:tRNA(fMet)-specific endonuclease VapC